MLGPVCLFTGQASSRFTVWATSHIPTTRKPGLLGQRLLWSSRYQFPPTFSLCFQDLHSRCPKIQQSQVKLEVLILSSLFPNSSVTQSSYPPTPHSRQNTAFFLWHINCLLNSYLLQAKNSSPRGLFFHYGGAPFLYHPSDLSQILYASVTKTVSFYLP